MPGGEMKNRQVWSVCPGATVVLDQIEALRFVTKSRVELSQRASGVMPVLQRQVILESADFTASHLEGFRIPRIAGAQDFGIESAGAFEFLHMSKFGKLKGMSKGGLVDRRLSEQAK